MTDEPPPVEGRVPKGVMPRSLRLAKPWNRSAPPRTAPVVGHPDEIAPHSPRLALRDLQVPKALQHPPFRRFWSGQLVALIGMWGQSTASNLVFLTLTSSAFLIGLINIVSAVPMLLLSLFGGVIADRFERRKILTMTQTVIASLSVVWAILIFTDRIAYWHVLVIAAVGGVVVSFDLPAGQAFLSQIVRREDMTEAIALNSASINATRIFGPILAGILIGVVGTGVAFVAHSTAVMIFVITIFSLRAMVPHSRPVGSRVPGITALRDGLRHIRHSDELIGLVGVTAIFSFLAVPPLLVLMSLYVTKTLGGSDAWVPTMTSIFGAGSLIAAIALFRGSRLEAAAGRRMRLTMAGLAVGLMWLALAPNPWLAIPGILIAGCSFEMGLIQVQTRVQALAPDDLRGRVLSVNGLAFNGVMPFSTLTISTATTELGAPLVLGACSVLVAICSVLIWKRYTWKAFVPAPAI
ncbi:MAG TPA: MFS transporter [Thermomicrobiales bacterium]|nr:MFS transporter [Thermomicrobiales bacterium]